jgi:nitrogenase molybdenum-iron protein alpha/beta subunit
MSDKEKQPSKLQKMGYEWIRVSQMYDKTQPLNSNYGKNCNHKGYEGLWCKLIKAVTSYAMTNDTVAVIHGPTNCAWAVRNFCSTNYSLYYGNAFLHMPSTNLNNSSIVNGAEKELINTLIEVDKKYKPQHIAVFDTCSTSLIGDNIQNCINKAQQSCSAKINFIEGAGYTSPPLGQSIQETSEKYIEMMEAPEAIKPRTVNILGQYKESHCRKKKKKRGKYPDDAQELIRYIEALGLEIHRVLISGDHDYIKTAPKASVNVISCPTWGLPLAKKMNENFNTPYLQHSVPTGIESTCRWIRDLAYFTETINEAEALIEKELSDIMPVFEKTKNIVKGKTALIECGRNSMTAFARPLALARFLQELGMKPYLFGLHPFELKAKGIDLQYFLWDGFNPLILNGAYHYQQPVNITNVTEDLNLKEDEYIYFSQDVFPLAKSGEFDPSSNAKVETSVHLRRVFNSPGRGVGFRGAKSLCESILDSVLMSQRKSKPTLYGRVHGKFYDEW